MIHNESTPNPRICKDKRKIRLTTENKNSKNNDSKLFFSDFLRKTEELF